MDPSPSSSPAQRLFQAHPRSFEENRYVYPVLSRRAGGISIGVNLNVDKICNFDCIYCQVERTQRGSGHRVDVERLAIELRAMVELVHSGQLFSHDRFCNVPVSLRRLNDIALSGDGEPTTCPDFEQVVAACAEMRRHYRLDGLKLVLITNATMFHREGVRRGLALLDAHNGEIWAKLDAGTEASYRQVDRSAIPFDRILTNLAEAARVRPIVIQSLFTRIHDVPPSQAEQEAFCQRLNDIRAAGGQIKLVQVHTVARHPAESWVTPLSDAEVDALAELVRQRTGLTAAAYYA
jgi:wyosine [tRNA(Phe)-imidazoG37] synthetase (radical SAM superfamily)